MDVRISNDAMGEHLGVEGVDQLVERAEAVCAWEKKRIELSNQPVLLAKKAEYAVALEEEQELKRRLYHAKPPQETAALRRRIVISWVVAAVLIVAGFVLSLLTLEPFRLGLKGIFYCIGIALVTPFLVEKTLELFSNERFTRVLTVVSCLGALMSLMLLAAIRGNLLGHEIRQASSPVVIEGEEPHQEESKNSFYEETLSLLEFVMILCAFSMEMDAGIAVHEAERMSASLGEDARAAQAALREVRARLSSLVHEIVTLENESATFVATFWRDFHWSMLKRTLKNIARWGVLPMLLLLPLSAATMRAQQPMDLVIAVDLSESVGHKGADGQTEFAKNVMAVTQFLGRLPAGASVTVLGITDNSFAQPYFLLRAKLDADPGHFGEKLAAGRSEMARAWKAKSERLQASFPQTDVLGALVLTSQLFEPNPKGRRKVLVIYSDMRQATRDLNLEAPRVIPLSAALAKVEREKLLPDMKDIDVNVLGADAAGRTVARWEQLRQFWEAYFERAGANLKRYSAFRDLPNMEP